MTDEPTTDALASNSPKRFDTSALDGAAEFGLQGEIAKAVRALKNVAAMFDRLPRGDEASTYLIAEMQNIERAALMAQHRARVYRSEIAMTRLVGGQR